MLRSFNDIVGSALHAQDGKIGHTDDLLFDDHKWTIRYVVAKTGGLLTRKRVLISPLGVANIEWENHFLKLHLTRQQIEDSPDVDTDQPVFRQMEARYFDYYGWPYYWTDLGIWGVDPRNPLITGDRPSLVQSDEASEKKAMGDRHLRSCRAVTGYAVEAEDAQFGHVKDFLFEVETWTIRYLVVHTKTAWQSTYKLIAPKWVHSIDWSGRNIQVDLTKQAIEASPPFAPDAPIDRAYEERLHRHYQRPLYWNEQSRPGQNQDRIAKIS